MLRHNLLPSRGCWAVALAFISGAVCAQSQRASHCFFDSGMGATFDLSPLSQSARCVTFTTCVAAAARFPHAAS